MIRLMPIVGLVSVSVLALLLGAARVQDHLLPGVIEEIDAANFPSLQAALDAAIDGGVVRIPAGTFEINQPLVIRNNDITIYGAGASSQIKNLNNEGLPAIVIAHVQHDRTSNDREHELWRVRIADLRVTGNEASGDGIVAYNTNELFLDGISASYHGGDGISLRYCYEDPRIVDSLITYNGQTGLSLIGCHDIVVSANQFEENHDALHCFDGFNLCMTGNCLDDHLGRGVVIENTYGSVVTGNMIEECNAAALVLDRDCYGICVSANVVAHNGAGCVILDAHGCTLAANSFVIMQRDAVFIGPNSGRIAVCGNSFSDSYVGSGEYHRSLDDRGAAGLSIDDASAVLVSDNLFSGSQPQAISLRGGGTAPSSIRGNLFVDSIGGVVAKKLDQTLSESNYVTTDSRR